MLQLRPNCECCGRALAPDSTEARICSFECTFCAACADATLKGRCPNCGGELVAKARRAGQKLLKDTAATPGGGWPQRFDPPGRQPPCTDAPGVLRMSRAAGPAVLA